MNHGIFRCVCVCACTIKPNVFKSQLYLFQLDLQNMLLNLAVLPLSNINKIYFTRSKSQTPITQILENKNTLIQGIPLLVCQIRDNLSSPTLTLNMFYIVSWHPTLWHLFLTKIHHAALFTKIRISAERPKPQLYRSFPKKITLFKELNCTRCSLCNYIVWMFKGSRLTILDVNELQNIYILFCSDFFTYVNTGVIRKELESRINFKGS